MPSPRATGAWRGKRKSPQRSKDQPVASVRLRWSGPNFNWEEFARDSPLEGGGFEPSVPGREITVMEDGPGCLEKGADLLGNRRFESTSLQRGVRCEPGYSRPTFVTAARLPGLARRPVVSLGVV